MSQYSANQFVEDENHSWNIIQKFIEPNSTVLDIGCSSGNLGEGLIKEKKCTVDGIELSQDDAEKARKKLRNVYVMNIESDSIDDIGARYDFIVMADVIEHLVDPVHALERIKGLLKPGGVLVFSIPNMAHLSVRLALLEGDFDYTQTGLLDETHLHYYTKRNIEKVFREASYKITDLKYTWVVYPTELVKQRLSKLGLSLTNDSVFSKTEANAFQYVGTAVPAKKSSAMLKHTVVKELPHQVHLTEHNNYIDNLLSQVADYERIKQENNKHKATESKLGFRLMKKLYAVIGKEL